MRKGAELKKSKGPRAHTRTIKTSVLVVDKAFDRSLSLRPNFEQNPVSGEHKERILRWCPNCRGPVLLEIPPFVKTLLWTCPYCGSGVAEMLTEEAP